MVEMILTGVVRSDGIIESREKIDLPPGQVVELRIQTPKVEPIPSVSLEEAKRLIALDMSRELTEEEKALYDQAYEQLDRAASDTLGLPADFPDELDHYLYGTPRRIPKD